MLHEFVQVLDGHQLRDDGQVRGLLGLHQVQDALRAQALEGVGRGTGLVGAAAQHRGAGGLYGLGGLDDGLQALDRAGAGDHGDLLLAADAHAAAVDDRVLRVEEAVDLLVRRGDARHGVDIGVDGDLRLVHARGVADQAEHVVVLAVDGRDRQAHLLERMDELVDFLLGGALFHRNNHRVSFLSWM